MPLRQRRLCFRPAVVVLSSGAKTDHGEPMRTRATLPVSPWLFIRWSSLPIRKTSELPDFRTSKRIAALGEASAICTQWGFLRSDGTETERGKEVGRRCCFATVGSVFAPLESTPSSGENRHRRGHCAEGAFRQHRHCVLPRGLTRAGRRKATFANQLRGVVAFAESPWPLTRTQTGADEKSARCAILAGSPWVIFPRC